MPGAQGSHCPLPLSNGVEPDCGLLYLPASQVVQALARTPLNLPAPQSAQKLEPDCPSPFELCLPAAQSVQLVEPNLSFPFELYSPAAQLVQELACPSLYSPAAQLVQELACPSLNLPAAQLVQPQVSP